VLQLVLHAIPPIEAGWLAILWPRWSQFGHLSLWTQRKDNDKRASDLWDSQKSLFSPYAGFVGCSDTWSVSGMQSSGYQCCWCRFDSSLAYSAEHFDEPGLLSVSEGLCCLSRYSRSPEMWKSPECRWQLRWSAPRQACRTSKRTDSSSILQPKHRDDVCLRAFNIVDELQLLDFSDGQKQPFDVRDFPLLDPLLDSISM